MKKMIFLIFAIALFSCGKKKSTEVKHFAHDSGKVFALYRLGSIAYADIVRQDVITQHRFSIVDSDSNVAKKQWITDTFYQIQRLDSLKRPVTYLLSKDSVLIVTAQFEPILKKYNLHFQPPDTTKH